MKRKYEGNCNSFLETMGKNYKYHGKKLANVYIFNSFRFHIVLKDRNRIFFYFPLRFNDALVKECLAYVEVI